MVKYKQKDRLVPYKLLVYLLYGQGLDWLQQLEDGKVRVITGPAARALRLKSTNLWIALYWLEEQKLVKYVKKEQKRGQVIVALQMPSSLTNG